MQQCEYQHEVDRDSNPSRESSDERCAASEEQRQPKPHQVADIRDDVQPPERFPFRRKSAKAGGLPVNDEVDDRRQLLRYRDIDTSGMSALGELVVRHRTRSASGLLEAAKPGRPDVKPADCGPPVAPISDLLEELREYGDDPVASRDDVGDGVHASVIERKSTRLNSSHL